LIETVWEIRFSGTSQGPVADLLPGMLFQLLPNRFRKVFKLPAADIPEPLMHYAPDFSYVPKIRLEGSEELFRLEIRWFH